MSDELPTSAGTRASGSSVNLQRILLLLMFACCLPTVAAFGARWWWVLELATHFRVQYVCLMLPFVVLLLLQRRFRLVLLPSAVLLFNLALILPLYLPASQPDSAGTGLRAVSANVYTRNDQPQRFIEFVRREQPDFIFVMEVDDCWMSRLEALRDEYPFVVSRPRRDNFGAAFFSRIPWKNAEMIELGGSTLPTILAKFNIDGQPLTIIGTHPLPPVSRVYAAGRNRQVIALGELVEEIRGPLVVLCDLNMTSWSPHFRDLIAATGLHDSRKGFGVQPTWPQHRFELLIPIDHALVSPEIAVRDRRVGSDIGSDHGPIVVDFGIRP